jgi:hypothetical protein
MEEINFNGKVYVLKEDVDKELKNNNFASGGSFKILSKDCNFMDEVNVMALAHVQLGDGFIGTKISVSYLLRALKVMEAMRTNKDSYDYISLAWKKDYPAILGRINDNGEAIGIVIAPRVDGD